MWIPHQNMTLMKERQSTVGRSTTSQLRGCRWGMLAPTSTTNVRIMKSVIPMATLPTIVRPL